MIAIAGVERSSGLGWDQWLVMCRGANFMEGWRGTWRKGRCDATRIGCIVTYLVAKTVLR